MKKEMTGSNGISWTVCKSFTPHSGQMPAPHYAIATGHMLFLTTNKKALKAKLREIITITT